MEKKRKSPKKVERICKGCNEKFMASPKALTCSTYCRNTLKMRKKSEELSNDSSLTLGIDYVECKWCNCYVNRVYGQHMRYFHADRDPNDYRKEFPDSPLSSNSDNMKIAQGFVRFTKSEEGRKFFSDHWKGDKNINSKARSTEDERKGRSPFSKEFYKRVHGAENDLIAEKMVSEFTSEALKNRLTETQYEYWLEKCDGDEKEAKRLYKDRQATFTLEKLVDKYGKEEGTDKWKERQTKWKSKVFSDKQWIGGGKSKISYDLFEEIRLRIDPSLVILVGKEERFIRKGSTVFKYDFCIKSLKKIIEFNGDFWHCNPDLFNEDFFNKVKKMTAKEIWEYDKMKENLARSKGYDYLTIWENDYRKYPEETVQKCIEFLNA